MKCVFFQNDKFAIIDEKTEQVVFSNFRHKITNVTKFIYSEFDNFTTKKIIEKSSKSELEKIQNLIPEYFV